MSFTLFTTYASGRRWGLFVLGFLLLLSNEILAASSIINSDFERIPHGVGMVRNVPFYLYHPFHPLPVDYPRDSMLDSPEKYTM